jgi:hypothetical protein
MKDQKHLKNSAISFIILTLLAIYGLGLTIYNNFIGSISSSPIIHISIIILTIIAYSLVLKGFLIIAKKNNKLRKLSFVYFILFMLLSTIQSIQSIRIQPIIEIVNSLFVGSPLILILFGVGITAIIFGKELFNLKGKYGNSIKGFAIMTIIYGITDIILIPFVFFSAIFSAPYLLLVPPLLAPILIMTTSIFGAMFFLNATKQH